MLRNEIKLLGCTVALLSLVACGTTNTPPLNGPTASSYPASSGQVAVNGYGVVQGIDIVPRQSAGLGVGTVAGAVVGGVLGHQVGQGRGNTAATIAGAAGGAMAGRAVDNNSTAGQVYRITLRMDDGTTQSLMQETQPSLRIGDRIRLTNGVVERL